jgi:hypothetical protein
MESAWEKFHRESKEQQIIIKLRDANGKSIRRL